MFSCKAQFDNCIINVMLIGSYLKKQAITMKIYSEVRNFIDGQFTLTDGFMNKKIHELNCEI